MKRAGGGQATLATGESGEHAMLAEDNSGEHTMLAMGNSDEARHEGGPLVGNRQAQRPRWRGWLRIGSLLLLWASLTVSLGTGGSDDRGQLQGASLWLPHDGSAAVWLAWTTLTGLLLCSLLPAVALQRTTVRRELAQSRIVSGEPVVVRLTVRTPLLLPFVWVTVREELIAEARADATIVASRRLLLPWLRREWQMEYTLTDLPRGVYRWRSTELNAGDLLGAGERRLRVSAPSCLHVAPTRSVSVAGRMGGSADGAGASEETSLLRLRASQAGPGIERRPYRSGDALRHLDWRAAAKGGEWLTRLEPVEAPEPLRILLDRRGERSPAGQRLLDAAAELALAAAEAESDRGAELLVDGLTVARAGAEAGYAQLQQALAEVALPMPGERCGVWAPGWIASGSGSGAAGDRSLLIITSEAVRWQALAVAALDSGLRAEIWEVAEARQESRAADGLRAGADAGGDRQAGHSNRPDRADRVDAEVLAHGSHMKRWVVGETGLRLQDSWGGGARDAVIS